MRKFKNIILPLAVILGLLFHEYLDKFGMVVPYLIFCMLFITYCDLHVKDLKMSGFHISMLLFQIVTSIGLYMIINPFNTIVAQGVLITIIVPTATAAVVVAGMLGANIGTMTTYTLLSNLIMAVICPLVFSHIGYNGSFSFLHTLGLIFAKIFPLLVLPLLLALVLKRISPNSAKFIVKHNGISLYLWAISLTIAIGKAINYIVLQNESQHKIIIFMAIAAILICVLQFTVGRLIGKKYGDVVAGGQAIGQKNTILAIWMAQTFLNPLSSIVPAIYIICQNLFNGYQIWQKNR